MTVLSPMIRAPHKSWFGLANKHPTVLHPHTASYTHRPPMFLPRPQQVQHRSSFCPNSANGFYLLEFSIRFTVDVPEDSNNECNSHFN